MVAYPVWPSATVPDGPEYDGYRRVGVTNEASFQPDVGPPTTWRRSTLNLSKVSASFVWNTTQRDAFDTFYQTTLKDGSLAFQWDNPAYSATGIYKFDPSNPPQEEAVGYEMWRVSIVVYKLRDA